MKVAIVGSGNVATHLARGLAGAGMEVCAVFSRNPGHAARLAQLLGGGTSWYDDFSRLESCGADAVIVSVADNALESIAASLPDLGDVPVFHTSGTVGMEVLSCASSRYGIIYPLQTFSREVAVDISAVPFFTEGCNESTLAVADSIAGKLSAKVAHADAPRRRVLHVAGVLSCNFPNFLWECVEELLAKAGYPLDVVEPLVRATVDKAFSVGPHASQTGPARRGDIEVVEQHAASLDAPLDSVYRTLSEMIMQKHNDEQNKLST